MQTWEPVELCGRRDRWETGASLEAVETNGDGRWRYEAVIWPPSAAREMDATGQEAHLRLSDCSCDSDQRVEATGTMPSGPRLFWL